MTNIELLAEDILRMKHRDKIMKVLPLFLTPHDPSPTTPDAKEKTEVQAWSGSASALLPSWHHSRSLSTV